MRNTITPTRGRTHAGFTLLELMTAVAIAGILAAVAIPSMRDFILNNRLTGEANDLLRSLQIARTEATKRQQNVAVCGSANPTASNPACSASTFTSWIVFQDTNNNRARDSGEQVIESHEGLSTIHVVVNAGGGVSYALSGFANPSASKTTTVVMCDDRGNQAIGNSSTARAIKITDTGRARVTKAYTDVTDALTLTGTCPP